MPFYPIWWGTKAKEQSPLVVDQEVLFIMLTPKEKLVCRVERFRSDQTSWFLIQSASRTRTPTLAYWTRSRELLITSWTPMDLSNNEEYDSQYDVIQIQIRNFRLFKIFPVSNSKKLQLFTKEIEVTNYHGSQLTMLPGPPFLTRYIWAYTCRCCMWY